MITNRSRRLRAAVFITIATLLLLHSLHFIFPEVLSSFNNRIIDRLFDLRANTSALKPRYDDRIVHIDINQTTLKKLKISSLDRHHHAHVVENLGAMQTALQIYDFVFSSKRLNGGDQQLIEATKKAANVFYGIVFFEESKFEPKTLDANHQDLNFLKKTTWDILANDIISNIPKASGAIITFPQLTKASKGLGSINLRFDSDGVYRRYPLIFRVQGEAYPSIVLRAVCDYLDVEPADIIIEPARFITLKNAQFPEKKYKKDIVIPIDDSASMIVDFIGKWGRMRHYNFADIFYASDNRKTMSLWKEELNGKIVIVSEVLSGSSDTGSVPTDSHYPLSGVHANAIHTILTESFFMPANAFHRGIIILIISLISITAFLYLPATYFSMVIALSSILYSFFSVGVFLQNGWIQDFVVPNLFLFVILVAMLINRVIESTRLSFEANQEKALVEKELEIGRRIQADFFPSEIPDQTGWDIAATIRPAKQVAGDFYDIFALPRTNKLVVVIGDVCDKGVGAAIFMALFRSLIRATCQQKYDETEKAFEPNIRLSEYLLSATVKQTNNYISLTHEKACMFATLFMAIFDTHTGAMDYINCGHEPPLLINSEGKISKLYPTGPAVGSFPDITFRCCSLQLNKRDLLFACTDGITEAPNPEGEAFNQSRLHEIVCFPHQNLKDKLETIELAVKMHCQNTNQFDDITMLAIKRLH